MVNRLISTGNMGSLYASASGATPIIATQTTSGFIVVNSFRMIANTTTTNQIAQFRLTGTTTAAFTSALDGSGEQTDVFLGNGDQGWRLPKGQGLSANLATGGAVMFDVLYSVVDDF